MLLHIENRLLGHRTFSKCTHLYTSNDPCQLYVDFNDAGLEAAIEETRNVWEDEKVEFRGILTLDDMIQEVRNSYYEAQAETCPGHLIGYFHRDSYNIKEE
jgi:hypothetical protein